MRGKIIETDRSLEKLEHNVTKQFVPARQLRRIDRRHFHKIFRRKTRREF